MRTSGGVPTRSLAQLIGALIGAGLRLSELAEPEEDLPLGADTPCMLALVAFKEG